MCTTSSCAAPPSLRLPSIKDGAPDLIGWLDLETTGLDDRRDKIVELGIVLTTTRLQEVAARSWLVYPTHLPLSEWDQTAREMHDGNGLLHELRTEVVADVGGVEEAACAWLAQKGVTRGALPLAGYSIDFDRRFLRRHMPQLEGWFSRRLIDISGVRQLVQWWNPAEVYPRPLKAAHRSLADCRAAIAEARHYMREVFAL
jgi:oligoribonuclease